jgi:hypothetical protein
MMDRLGWHGRSAGNAGGPWDQPSGPMNGCMRGLIAVSQPASQLASQPASDSDLA